MPTRFELHGFAFSGPTYKVALALSLLGEPFDYVHVDLMGGEHKQPSYLFRQRYGQVPMLVDRNNGRQLCQSAAILEYLADMMGRFGGANLDERLQVREWMYWDFDRLAAPLYKARVIKIGFRQASPDVFEDCVAAAKNALSVLENHLAGRTWLVGEAVSIADIDIYGVVTFSNQAGIELAAYPRVSAWTGRVEALPGFKAQKDLLPMESRVAA
ncbi:glutathione S-transferase family protein [Microvirga calopogonii]|uniref:glutathione S-transferase family protein n=1 Tax=Microvirga calopogonii TaxID=2078013 RepID=UPI0013B39316|nr:glutathione S-transferase family protein [Microvirga calopogonii]